VPASEEEQEGLRSGVIPPDEMSLADAIARSKALHDGGDEAA
jgi:hypothetical protein